MDIETMGENKFYWIEHGCLHAFLSKKIPGNNCAQAGAGKGGRGG